MPNITQIEVFNQPTELYIPLSVAQPTTVTTVASPNSQSTLEDMITLVEKDILVNALGLTIYNELQTALNDLLAADQKWRDLVEGVEYDGKIWEGLNTNYSLLAFAIYYMFVNQNTQFLTAVGVGQPNAQNSTIVTPFYKLTNAWNKFTSKYQDGATESPNITYSGGVYFEDWFSQSESVYVSLYRFLVDKKDDYGWDLSNFTYYDKINSFGL